MIRRGPLGGVIDVPQGYYVCDLYDWRAKRCLVRATTEAAFRDAVRVGFEASNVMIARQCAIFAPGEDCPLAQMPKEFKGPGSEVQVATPPASSTENINVDPLATVNVSASGSTPPVQPTATPPQTPGAPASTSTQSQETSATVAGCAPGVSSVQNWGGVPTDPNKESPAFCAITGDCHSAQPQTMCAAPVTVEPKAASACADDLTKEPIVGPHLNVFFINGINTRLFEAEKNLAATAQLVRELQLPLPVCHTLLWNTSSGFFTDAGEVQARLTGGNYRDMLREKLAPLPIK